MENNQIKLMLVEDHDSVREAFCATLRDLFDFDVICSAANGKEALKLLSIHKPTIILLDVEMPVMNGFETLKIIKEQYPSIKVIMFTAYDGYLLVSQSLLKGADAVISKSLSLDDLVITIQLVATEELKTAIIENPLSFEFETPSLGEDTIVPGKGPLTKVEIKILQLICERKTNKQISEILNIHVKTVEFHRRRIHIKTESKTLIDLYRYALRYAIVLF